MKRLWLGLILCLGIAPAQAQQANIVYPPPGAINTSQCAVLCSGLVLKAQNAYLYSLQVTGDTTLSGAAWWVMVFDATTIPADGAVTPKKCYGLPSGSVTFTAAFPTPINLVNGYAVGISTTGCFTKTATVHAFISGDYQ